ncbi:MAG: TerB family tellurite resistance protein, partial [Pseudorhodoplanes sp.]|nr:TerB family tellurite resistance protein [Pseudorhodoplanes sp.]
KVNEFEDNVVWRAADLLGISARDRVSLKQRVAEQGVAAKAGS